MARCYTMSERESRDWNEGGWLSLEVQEDIIEYAQKRRWYEPVVVTTHDHRLAFALTPEQIRS